MRTLRHELCGIFVFCPGIGRNVGGIVELFRVDEQRHDYPIGLLKRCTHEAQMSFMQCPMVGTIATLAPGRPHPAT